MTKIDDGGAAFPMPPVPPTGPRPSPGAEPFSMSGVTDVYISGAPGMSLRDWFATHCPDGWIEKRLPCAHGDMKEALLRRGIISAQAAHGSSLHAYNGTHIAQLEIALRWEYADAMIAARKS